MKRLCLLLFFYSLVGSLPAQQLVLPATKKLIFSDDNGQRIAFEMPQAWKFDGSVFSDAKSHKVGEFIGTSADCRYKTGSGFLKSLRVGEPEAPNPEFTGSRTLVIGITTWTEGVLHVDSWDGYGNTRKWYAHCFFALLNKKCFEITFYSKQRQLPNEENVRAILASIKPL
jgi:hypothetical protein